MTPAFNFAFKYLLGDEGTKFTMTAGDTGGATKFGVTLKMYQAFLKRPVDLSEIMNLSQFQAQVFYWEEYWKKLSLDRLTSQGIAVAIFDTGVLYGPGTAAVLAQKTINKLSGAVLKSDGILGDSSIGLLNGLKTKDFLSTYKDLILNRIDTVIAANPCDEKFRKGWANRADKLSSLNT